MSEKSFVLIVNGTQLVPETFGTIGEALLAAKRLATLGDEIKILKPVCLVSAVVDPRYEIDWLGKEDA